MSKIIKIIAKVENYNKGPNFCNITIKDADAKIFNIKLAEENLAKIIQGRAYLFEVEVAIRKEKEILKFASANLIEDCLTDEELNLFLPIFYDYSKISYLEMKCKINDYIDKIRNETIKIIVNEIYKKNEKHFFLHPAGISIHHAYWGGLANHTLSMLNLTKMFLENYKYLNQDLLYAGIILHDMAKIQEISNLTNKYSIDGSLIGHLVMMTNEIEHVTRKFNFENSEEAILLKHIIISHHGLLAYGSPKRPQIGEALLIWYLDTIDSKFSALGDAYEKVKPGEFSDMLLALDKIRFYKPKL